MASGPSVRGILGEMERDKNIQVIDGAENCTYSVYATNAEAFREMFPDGQDIEFADDLIVRLGQKRAGVLRMRRPFTRVAPVGVGSARTIEEGTCRLTLCSSTGLSRVSRTSRTAWTATRRRRASSSGWTCASRTSTGRWEATTS